MLSIAHQTVRKGAIVVLLFACSICLRAQTASDIFSSDKLPVTYLGIDFTQFRLIGDSSIKPAEIKNKAFNSINHLIINESAKYNIKKTFRRDSLITDISVTDEQNKKTDESKILSTEENDYHRLTDKDIKQLVKSYDFGGRTGVGLVIVVEAFNKYLPKASMFITFVDMQKKQVLFTDRMMGPPGGAGFRNYWAKSILEVLKDIDNSRYDVWVRKNTQ